jgi:hypothetical protein
MDAFWCIVQRYAMDYTGQGVHHLADCIHKIINNPEDSRIVMKLGTGTQKIWI